MSVLTPRSQQVLGLAATWAKKWPSNSNEYVSTEHILLALVEEGEGIAARVLAKLGVTEQMIRDELAKLIGVEPHKCCPTCGQETKG